MTNGKKKAEADMLRQYGISVASPSKSGIAAKILLPIVLFALLLSACSLQIKPAYTEFEISAQMAAETVMEIAAAPESSTQAQTSSVSDETTQETTTAEQTKSEETPDTTRPISAETTTIWEEPIVYTEPVLTYGTAGRLDIPSVGIGVALNYVELKDGTAQSVVDAEDSAAYFLWRDSKYVIDAVIPEGMDVQVGDACVISIADGYADEYICTRVCAHGKSTGADLLDENGVTVESSEDGGLVMYTCNDCRQNITITYWQRTA